MSARYFVWETREDECAEPDWYEVGPRIWHPRPSAYIKGDGVVRYFGPITREMLRKLDAALGKPWGLS